MRLYQEALNRFLYIYRKAAQAKLNDYTAFTLSTADRTGRPSARVVLLKGFDERGFVFYSNFESRKGRELQQNPWAAMTFYWDALDEHQIRIEGRVEPVSPEEADGYWITRPRQSQIGAWASLQSQELDRPSTFLKRIAKFAWQFRGGPVPRPKNWSGFRVVPQRIEFWKRRRFRLHERVVYERHKGSWRKSLVYP